MDLEDAMRKARREFLERLPPIKAPASMEDVKFRTVYSKEVYEKSKYVEQG